jgi:hypothetical protein
MFRLVLRLTLVAAAVSVPGALALAQSPSVAQIVAANAGNDKATCSALRPVVTKSPKSASDVVAAAASSPASACGLGECLSSIQRGMKKSNAGGAKTISEIVATAPPSLQSCYALALAPSGPPAGAAGQGTQVAASEGGVPSGSAGAGGNGAGFGGFGGVGGGAIVSPVKP